MKLPVSSAISKQENHRRNLLSAWTQVEAGSLRAGGAHHRYSRAMLPVIPHCTGMVKEMPFASAVFLQRLLGIELGTPKLAQFLADR